MCYLGSINDRGLTHSLHSATLTAHTTHLHEQTDLSRRSDIVFSALRILLSCFQGSLISLHDLAMCIIERSNSAAHEASTAGTSKVLQSQPVTQDSTNVSVAAIASSIPSSLLYIFPCSRGKDCVAPISTAALSHSKTEPHHNVPKGPRQSSLCSSD